MVESAGILGFRKINNELQFLLVHPGGPFFIKKDLGVWTIPKGLVEEGEALLATALREFKEEIGFTPLGEYLPLGHVKQKGGKIVHGFAVEMDFDVKTLLSNTFTIEWPPRSGKMTQFPEVDRAEWFNLAEAENKINPAQVDFLLRLGQLIAV